MAEVYNRDRVTARCTGAEGGHCSGRGGDAQVEGGSGLSVPHATCHMPDAGLNVILPVTKSWKDGVVPPTGWVPKAQRGNDLPEIT